MPYKAFVSSSNNEEGNTFAYAIRDALFEINTYVYTAEDLPCVEVVQDSPKGT